MYEGEECPYELYISEMRLTLLIAELLDWFEQVSEADLTREALRLVRHRAPK
jgi:hypothetical protein